jgi:hypothetical protein
MAVLSPAGGHRPGVSVGSTRGTSVYGGTYPTAAGPESRPSYGASRAVEIRAFTLSYQSRPSTRATTAEQGVHQVQ